MTNIVNKPWGYEHWIADGDETPYALKRIFFKAGSRSSLQVHREKLETIYILSGSGRIYKSKDIFDIDSFLISGITEDNLKKYELDLEVIDLYPGVHFNTVPGIVHRVVAETDLEFIEVSTTELDDVVRIQDDLSRPHGRIDNEHNGNVNNFNCGHRL